MTAAAPKRSAMMALVSKLAIHRVKDGIATFSGGCHATRTCWAEEPFWIRASIVITMADLQLPRDTSSAKPSRPSVLALPCQISSVT
jgi:threonine dehydratase